jgi:NodT family efflux transporter outer membrane factor (OMF) lipoprotein
VSAQVRSLFLIKYLTGQKMSHQMNVKDPCRSAVKLGLSAVALAVLSACANYAGIHSDQQMEQPQQLQTTQSLPAESGHWPASDWARQFGDAQLTTLLDEALKGSPTLAQARARIASAQAYSETAKAGTLPSVDADYSLTRRQYSSTALVPPPYGGSWQTENTGLLSASYDLDLWGKNREALKSAVSDLQASQADEEVVKLTLTTSVARTYNQLARLYALRDIQQSEVEQRAAIKRITEGRIAAGLDTEVERKTAQANLASARAALTELDGSILTTRYQLAALMGEGPDRGLAISRPTLGVGDEVRLPDNLPADLVSRRPDIVAARWRVDAITHQVKVAKAEFYPDINLSAAIGLDAFGFGRFLTAASRTANAGPAIHLPIFDAGALRAQLKSRYADFDDAVATYDQTLVNALSEVATQLAQIRSSDKQLADTQAAQQAARQADELAIVQYQGGLTNQLTVLSADLNRLQADQAVIDLAMSRRDQQIALASALGGGYVDTSSDATDSVAVAAPKQTLVAAH